MGVVENLQLHARVGCITLSGIMNTQAVVAPRWEQKIELEDIVRILFFCNEVSALADENTVLDQVFGVFPAGEVFAVENALEALFVCLRAEGQQQGKCDNLFFHVSFN